MIVAETELTDDELPVFDGFLARVEGGRIPNTEALDGLSPLSPVARIW